MTKDLNNLQRLLSEVHQWPGQYTFKFICTPDLIVRLEEATGLSGFRQRASSKGNYVSLTLQKVMVSPEAVLDIYHKAQAIDGVMVL